MPSTAGLEYSPCGQVPWPGTEAGIKPTETPETDEDTDWSVPHPPPHTTFVHKAAAVQQQSRPRPLQPSTGTTPDFTLPEDRTIGNGHRSLAIAVSAKTTQQKSGDTGRKLTYLDLITGPFIVEAFSGSGRMAAHVRKKGIQAFEFDLTQQGGRRNILHANVLHELRALIAHPQCSGIWFGYPCGTFSSARRNDGGPGALRGTNSKDIWGLPHLVGKERGRVDSANKLLLRMHELMKLCEVSNVPLYFGNPQSSKLWMHPIIKTRVRHKSSHLVTLDYCQCGTEWKKPTSILSFGNSDFHTGKSVRCKTIWCDGRSLCSKSGKPHITLSGCVHGASKVQYRTNVACRYPPEFCEYVSDLVWKPPVKVTSRNQKGEHLNTVDDGANLVAMPAGPAVSMHLPSADHYLTHLPKHLGCKACMNCKLQRKHCRDHVKGRQRKLVDVVKTDKTNPEINDLEKLDAPKVFGDLVTSACTFAIQRNSASPARSNDTTALVVKYKATDWVAAYPSKRKTAENITMAVNDCKGSETVKRWYSGAPELHAACRKLGTRHDVSDPHRSGTNCRIERTNRTVIEGARCLLFQSSMPYKYWDLALKCFAGNYNYAPYNSKRGTNGNVERHGHKFRSEPLQFVCKLLYLPRAEREVEMREKIDPSLRDGIFVGYRPRSGCKWAGQYEVIGCDTYAKITKGSCRKAYVHAVSEVYIPGSAGDDQEQHPTFQVAGGHLTEAAATEDEES